LRIHYYTILNASITIEKEACMKDSGNLHKKVQEMCDCYATTDPLKEMSILSRDADTESAAIKWLALAALHGVNQNAEQISIVRDNDGRISVIATYRETDLPSPGAEVGQRVFDTLREVTHIDADKGKTALALGVRDSSIELNVKIKKKNGGEKITIHFPVV
jgi:hypothetical protein